MKKIMILIMFVLLSFNVLAVHTLTFPYFMDVNESELVSIYDGVDLINETAILFIDGGINVFNNTGIKHKLFITGTEEQDLEVFIEVHNSSSEVEQHNTSDTTRETFITVSDQTLYGWRTNHTDFNHTIGNLEHHQICPLIQSQLGTPLFTAYVGETNNSNSSKITWSQGDILTVPDTYDYKCINIPQNYTENHTSFIEYFVIRCTNCDTNNRLRLSIDTNTTLANMSFSLNNFTSPIVNITTGNVMFVLLELHGEPYQTFSETFRFRIPFYINISLYNDFNQTLQTQFDYIYLEEYDGLNLTNLHGYLNEDTGNIITKYATFGLWDRTTPDVTLSYWGAVTNNYANIKLYEANNYSINLLTVKTFLPNGWNEEFILPQYSSSKVKTKLNNRLEINNETNQSAYVLISEFEADKRNVIKTFGSIILILLVFVGGFVVAFTSGHPGKSISATILITTILAKLLGLG